MDSSISIAYQDSDEPILTFIGFKDRENGTTDTEIRLDDEFLAEAAQDMSTDEVAELVGEILDKAVAKLDGYRLLIELKGK